MAGEPAFVEFDGDLPAYYDPTRREPRHEGLRDVREYAFNLTTRDRFSELLRRINGAKLVLQDAEAQVQGVKKGLFWWKASSPAEKKAELARKNFQTLEVELVRLKGRMEPGGDLHAAFLENLAIAERRIRHQVEVRENRV